MADDPRFRSIVATSDAVASTTKRSEKTDLLAELLRTIEPDRVDSVVSILMGELTTGPIGVGPTRLRAARPDVAAAESSLSLGQIEEALAAVAAERGPGSVNRKVQRLRDLLESATTPEQSFLLRLCFGELRQGALGGVMVDAVAKASSTPKESVRRAYMLSGDLGLAARVAREGGHTALAQIGLRLMRPVEPMLASSAETAAEALERHSSAVFEWKLDGARIQVHKEGDAVRVFTRNLRDVAPALPEVVDAVSALPSESLVLDGEAIALKTNGRPESFQVTMGRFGRAKADEDAPGVRLTPFFFDILYQDGETLVDLPLRLRHERLSALIPDQHRLSRIETADPAEAEAFLASARAKGHEGVMAKDPDSPYQAGRRGKGWLKLKPANTLDLVILAVERGSGRRAGWLSNIHLGARDPASGEFVMLGKTFKGMTDDVLRWQTEKFPEYVADSGPYVLRLHPHFVAEIAFNEIQRSPRYPAGLALRFARLKGYRPDKNPEDADTIDTVRALFETMTGEDAP